jgi:hypothetical protein
VEFDQRTVPTPTEISADAIRNFDISLSFLVAIHAGVIATGSSGIPAPAEPVGARCPLLLRTRRLHYEHSDEEWNDSDGHRSTTRSAGIT